MIAMEYAKFIFKFNDYNNHTFQSLFYTARQLQY